MLFYRILTGPVQWSINFVTVIALLYLFHYQGRKRQKMEQPQRIYNELLPDESLKVVKDAEYPRYTN